MDSRLTQLGDEIRVVGDGALNAATKYFNLFCAKREEDIPQETYLGRTKL